jgi:hypothetical protein
MKVPEGLNEKSLKVIVVFFVKKKKHGGRLSEFDISVFLSSFASVPTSNRGQFIPKRKTLKPCIN